MSTTQQLLRRGFYGLRTTSRRSQRLVSLRTANFGSSPSFAQKKLDASASAKDNKVFEAIEASERSKDILRDFGTGSNATRQIPVGSLLYG